CAPRRCAAGCRGCMTCACGARANWCTRTIRRTAAACWNGVSPKPPLCPGSTSHAMDTLKAIEGLNWIKGGWRLFTRSPMTWIFSVITYWLIVALAGLIPVLGALLATLFIPAFAVSFMNISRELDQGRAAEPGLIFSGFRRNLPVLLRLGGIY